MHQNDIKKRCIGRPCILLSSFAELNTNTNFWVNITRKKYSNTLIDTIIKINTNDCIDVCNERHDTMNVKGISNVKNSGFSFGVFLLIR